MGEQTTELSLLKYMLSDGTVDDGQSRTYSMNLAPEGLYLYEKIRLCVIRRCEIKGALMRCNDG